MFCDGLHFNDAGNQLVAKLVLEKIESLLENWKIYHPEWSEFYKT